MDCAGIDPEEYAAYKQQAVRYKFMSSLMGTVSGASFVGVLTSICTAIVSAAGAGLAGIVWPVALVLAATGIACSFLSVRYSQKAQMLDSDFNAKKIAAATGRSLSPNAVEGAVEMENGPAQNRPKPLAPMINPLASFGQAMEADSVPEGKWSDRVQAAEKIDTALLAKTDADKPWGDRVQNPAATQQLAAL
jgi:hypothetical protein